MKKLLILLCILLFFLFSSCGDNTATQAVLSAKNQFDNVKTDIPVIYLDASYPTDERVSDLLSRMSLSDKAGQMVQGNPDFASVKDVEILGLGSLLSGGGVVPGGVNTTSGWSKGIRGYQNAALSRDIKIPLLYGSDAVHGHNNVYGAVIFPHNIGVGAANDAELTRQMGAYVAEVMKLTGVHWNFAPCVAVAQDPRWGRTYESFSSDPAIVSELGAAYLKGQQSGGVIATAKHYAGDGGTVYGTGYNYGIDRGNCDLSEEEFRAIHLAPYKRLVDEGVKCVMVSFSSYGGLKMHENKYMITDVLKGEFGFEGFVVSDWEGIAGINASTYEAKIAAGINAGVDMLMEPNSFKEAVNAIMDGVQQGAIPKERVDDAVCRILSVKFDMGLFEEPCLERTSVKPSSEDGRSLARKLAAKSQVLLKNNSGLLPFKSGQKIYVIGPAADNVGVQCGGWTLSWQGSAQNDYVPGTSILQALKSCAHECGIEIITDKARAEEADAVLLALGEVPYAEHWGDNTYLTLIGKTALAKNINAIFEARSLKKPVAALIVAGRNVMIDKYLGGWDAAVMCYLPGTEGGGVADVLVGKEPFTGKLPMPWYRSVDDIGAKNPDLLFDIGYGLTAE